MEDGGCWAAAVRVPLHWMEPYQLETPSWGVVERRLGDEVGREEEEGGRGKETKKNQSVMVLIYQFGAFSRKLTSTDLALIPILLNNRHRSTVFVVVCVPTWPDQPYC